MKKFLAAAALLAAPIAANAQTTPAPAPAATDAPMVVYDKALGPGWQNWSWGKTELSVDSAGARLPMKLEAEGWQAIYLHHDAFSTAPYRSLNLLLQTAGAEGDFRVVAIVGGKPVLENPADANSPPKGKTIHVKPGGWVQAVIPLGVLGVDKATIDGIWIQNATGTKAPNLYVADVSFKP